jgi:TolB-like protein/DNA-binding winged helix-turn-helix (wHTH) protein/Flp pilus assembly protein TadD
VEEFPQPAQELASRSYYFDRFTLDVFRGSLFRGREEIKLRPKSFELLRYLVENSGRLVGKEEIIRALWPDTAVTDDSLGQCVKDVRRALDDDSQTLIKTVPRRGYLFASEVTKSRTSAGSRAAEQGAPIRLVAAEPPAARAGSRRAVPILCMVGLGLAAALGWFFWRPRGEASPAAQTIAVLPFKTLVPDPAKQSSDARLGLGMADALIMQLSRIQGIVVRPTSAVISYMAPHQDPQSAGRNLRVDSLLEGSIQTSGDRIRVTVQLVSVRDGKPLWAEKFDEKFTDIFQLQDSIAEKVAESLRLKLTREDRERLRKRYAANPKAYQLYLEGLYFLSKTEHKTAIGYYRQALAAEPNYSPAYAGLANCYVALGNNGTLPSNEALPLAKAAALKAVALDDTLAEAHASLGQVKSFYEWDWSGGDREFQRAVELDPSSANVRQLYAAQLACVGRLDEATAQIGRALEIDPFSPAINLRKGFILYFQHKYDQAIEQYKRTIERSPSLVFAHMQLGWCYEQKAMMREAIEALEKAKALSVDTPPVMGSLARAYGLFGRRADALKLLDELESLSTRSHVPPFWFAEAYVGLGDKDRAFQYLERGVQEHEVSTPWMKMCPLCEPLHSDPRFAGLLRRMSLPL